MQLPGARLLLGLGTVAEWAARAEAAATGWLGDGEQARLAGIAAEPRRRQFLAARWLMRDLLRQHAPDSRPEDWSVSAAADGPPQVRLRQGADPATERLHLSISHSGAWVACALADHPVGIDLEARPPRRPRDLDALMHGIGSAGELGRWQQTAAAARELAFYRLWVIKEAWLKARGEGITPGRLRQLHTRLATPADARATLCEMRSGSLLACHAGAMALRALPPLPPAPEQVDWWAVDDAATPGNC